MCPHYVPTDEKIFVIGANKTGTTSIARFLINTGYRIGDQAVGESLLEQWAYRKFDDLLDYCQTADAFQDIPFSLLHTYQVLDQHFPKAKFILTVRDSADAWYDSLIRYHRKILGLNRTPTAADLKNYTYNYKGELWDAQKLIFGINEDELYDRNLYKNFYEIHIRSVTHYFMNTPEKLLTLNVGEPDAAAQLCAFLDVPYSGQPMPHLNASM